VPKLRGALVWSEAIGAGRTPLPHTAGPTTSRHALHLGTTGRPKGCMHSHRTVMSTAVGTQL